MEERGSTRPSIFSLAIEILGGAGIHCRSSFIWFLTCRDRRFLILYICREREKVRASLIKVNIDTTNITLLGLRYIYLWYKVTEYIDRSY